jgi:hypothetical protein
MDARPDYYDAQLQEAAEDFWLSSGHILLDVTEDGYLAVTDAFLKAYLARPELMPPPEACNAERDLHGKLMIAPAAVIHRDEVTAIEDADARENWKVMLDFRDVLLKAGTLERAYIELVQQGVGRTPPLFLGQLVHAIARQAFADCEDALVLRAAELFFRSQRVTVHNGAMMLADEDVIEQRQRRIDTAPLLAMFAGENANMDVLTRHDLSDYRARSDRFDFIIEFGSLDGGRAAFAKAIALWVRHLLGFDIDVEPIARIEDTNVRWLLGLDAEATALGNAVWHGEKLKDEDANRLIAFFRLAPSARSPFREAVRGYPVYLLLAMDGDRVVRVKPQNLITGLPLAEGYRYGA